MGFLSKFIREIPVVGDVVDTANSIGEAVKVFYELLKNLPRLIEASVAVVDMVFDFLIEFMPLLPDLFDFARSILPKVLGFLKAFIPQIIDFLEEFIPQILNILSTLIPEILNNIPNLVSSFTGIISNLPSLITEFFNLFSIFDDVILLGLKIAKVIFSEIPKFVVLILDKITELIPVVVDFFNAIIDINKRYRNISLIFLFLSPVLIVVNYLLNIIDVM